MGNGSTCGVQVLEEIEFHPSSALDLDSDTCLLKSTAIRYAGHFKPALSCCSYIRILISHCDPAVRERLEPLYQENYFI